MNPDPRRKYRSGCAGYQKKNAVLLSDDQEKKVVAYHEIGTRSGSCIAESFQHRSRRSRSSRVPQVLGYRCTVEQGDKYPMIDKRT